MTNMGDEASVAGDELLALQDEEQQAEDLRMLATYVKDNLFHKCKFVYSDSDLRYDGPIYRDYKKNCKVNFGGKRWNESGASRDMNMRIVWEEALKLKIQKKQMSQRRSAVYTVMQNKFVGEWMMGKLGCLVKGRKCLTCVAQNCATTV